LIHALRPADSLTQLREVPTKRISGKDSDTDHKVMMRLHSLSSDDSFGGNTNMEEYKGPKGREHNHKPN
jgi:hypothetical protein